jgi:hypothetical protein
VLDYGHDKQAWENADVNDYALSGGEKKDRRWEEGSSILHAGRDVLPDVLGQQLGDAAVRRRLRDLGAVRWGRSRRPPENPILAQNPAIGMYSDRATAASRRRPTGASSTTSTTAPSPDEPQRRLYTERMRLLGGKLSIEQSTSDEPIPSGVAPYRLRASARRSVLRAGASRTCPLDGDERRRRRARARQSAQPRPARVWSRAARRPRMPAGRRDSSSPARPGRATITLTYQRRLAGGGYRDVFDARGPVRVRIEVLVTDPGEVEVEDPAVGLADGAVDVLGHRAPACCPTATGSPAPAR